MAHRIKGITVEIGGDTTQLDKALRGVNDQLYKTQHDLREVERLLKLDPQNVELLAQKQRLLAENSEQAAKKLAIMEEASKGLDKTLSKTKLEDFNLELDLTRSKAKRAEKELDEFADALKDTGDASDTAGGGLLDLGGASSKLGDGFNVVSGAAANLASTVLTKVIEVAVELAKELWNLDEATEDLRENIALTKTAFETAGFSVETAKEAYHGLYQILGDSDQATEAAQHMAQLAATEEDLAKWTDIAAGVYGTFGDSLPIEGLLEAANETARVGEVTGSLADALNWLGLSEEEVNQQLSQMGFESDRARYLMELLGTAYDDAAETFKRNNETVMESREVQAQLDDELAEMGDQVARLKNTLFDVFGPALKIGLEVVTSLVWALNIAIKAVADVVGWVIDRVKQAIDLFKEFFGLGGDVEVPDPGGGPQKPRLAPASVLSYDIPALASGTVVKPNSPFLAVLGDNRREPEVVSPLSTIQDALTRAMDSRPSSGGQAATNRPLIVNMSIDGTKFARVMAPYLAGETSRMGIELTKGR